MGTEGEEQVEGLDWIKCSSCLILCVSCVILVNKIRQTKNEKRTMRKEEITKEVGGEKGGGRNWIRSYGTLRCRFRPWMTSQRQDELLQSSCVASVCVGVRDKWRRLVVVVMVQVVKNIDVGCCTHCGLGRQTTVCHCECLCCGFLRELLL